MTDPPLYEEPMSCEGESTTRQSPNTTRIIKFLEQNRDKKVSITEVSKGTKIMLKNMSRYVKELESRCMIVKETVQSGRIRTSYIYLTSRNSASLNGSITTRQKNNINTNKKTKKKMKIRFLDNSSLEIKKVVDSLKKRNILAQDKNGWIYLKLTGEKLVDKSLFLNPLVEPRGNKSSAEGEGTPPDTDSKPVNKKKEES